MRLIFLTRITALTFSAALAFAQNGNPNPGIHPPNSEPYGSSYGEWSAKWWQWLLPIPAANNPVLDNTGVNCAQGQTGHVWFLPGTFVGSAVRTCTIPNGISIMFPILNTSFGAGVGDCLTPPPGNPGPCDVQALRAGAAAQMDNPRLLEVTLDGVSLRDLATYRATSPIFSYILTTTDNLYNVAFGFHNPVGTYMPVVSDGYWVMLTPLTPGSHLLHFKAVLNDGSFQTEVTYHLFVMR